MMVRIQKFSDSELYLWFYHLFKEQSAAQQARSLEQEKDGNDT
jgi:hypothetical protein